MAAFDAVCSGQRRHSLMQEPVNPLHRPGESRRLHQSCQPQVEVVSEIVEKIPGLFPTEPRLLAGGRCTGFARINI